jgi:hypothetical protein
MIVHAPTESEVELLMVIWTLAVGLVVVSVTLDWLNLTVKCCGSNWEERLTVPYNPVEPTVTVTFCGCPSTSCMPPGLAVKVNAGPGAGFVTFREMVVPVV